MALYVVRPPNPPVGTDWQAVVPGQYLYNVTGVTALLTTPGVASSTMTDASGSGNDGTYHGTVLRVAGLVPGNLAAETTGSNLDYMEVDSTILNWTQAWTLEYLVGRPDTNASTGLWLWNGPGPASADFVQFGYDPLQQWLFIQGQGSGMGDASHSPAGSFPVDGNPHLIGVTYDPGTGAIEFYLDGVALGAIGPTVLWGPIVAVDRVFLQHLPAFPAVGTAGTHDELALYPSALSPARMAVHNAARGDISTYAPEVLADLPLGYYHLDDVIGGAGRQVLLEVTDGIRTIASIATGFAVATSGGPWLYSWQPRLNQAAEILASGTITVPTPDLILPAGYTIGTRTLDLVGTDQWSNVTIWWSDDRMISGLPVDYHNVLITG